jgi:hypothetical protein
MYLSVLITSYSLSTLVFQGRRLLISGEDVVDQVKKNMAVGQYHRSFRGINRRKISRQPTNNLWIKFVWRKQDLRTVGLS